MFGFKQAWGCLFRRHHGGAGAGRPSISIRLAPPLARYGFLVLAAVAVRAAMLAFRLQSWNEAKVIFAFHVTGTVMEIFKTQAGSQDFIRGRVFCTHRRDYLLSSFMYSAVRKLSRQGLADLRFPQRFSHYPRRWATVVLALAIYVAFLCPSLVAGHQAGPVRHRTLLYKPGAGCSTAPTFVPVRDAVPLLLGFVLVALFIWFAEDLGTFLADMDLSQPARRLADGTAYTKLEAVLPRSISFVMRCR